MEQKTLKIQDFAAVQNDGNGVLGKVLYYSLSNILIDKEKFGELCASIGFPYQPTRRTALADAFPSATGDIYERLVMKTDSGPQIFKIYCRDNKAPHGTISRELIKETVHEDTNDYKKLALFEDFIELLEQQNQFSRLGRVPLDANSMFVVDDAKQRDKMASAFYSTVRKEIAEYKERATHLIQSGSQSPNISDRLVLRIQGLEQKRGYYEGILSRELTDLNDQFTSLRYLSEELQIRARGLRVQKTVA